MCLSRVPGVRTPRRVRIRVVLPSSLFEALAEYARRRGVALDEAVEYAIRILLRENTKRGGLGSLPNRC